MQSRPHHSFESILTLPPHVQQNIGEENPHLHMVDRTSLHSDLVPLCGKCCTIRLCVGENCYPQNSLSMKLLCPEGCRRRILRPNVFIVLAQSLLYFFTQEWDLIKRRYQKCEMTSCKLETPEFHMHLLCPDEYDNAYFLFINDRREGVKLTMSHGNLSLVDKEDDRKKLEEDFSALQGLFGRGMRDSCNLHFGFECDEEEKNRSRKAELTIVKSETVPCQTFVAMPL